MHVLDRDTQFIGACVQFLVLAEFVPGRSGGTHALKVLRGLCDSCILCALPSNGMTLPEQQHLPSWRVSHPVPTSTGLRLQTCGKFMACMLLELIVLFQAPPTSVVAMFAN